MKDFFYKTIFMLALLIKEVIIWMAAFGAVFVIAFLGVLVLLPILTVGALVGGDE
jgi:hypothetical protein